MPPSSSMTDQLCGSQFDRFLRSASTEGKSISRPWRRGSPLEIMEGMIWRRLRNRKVRGSGRELESIRIRWKRLTRSDDEEARRGGP